QSARSAANAASLRRGMRGRGRGGELPPELLNLGVVDSSGTPQATPVPALILEATPEPEAEIVAPAKRGRAAKTARAKKPASVAAASAEKPAAKPRRPRAKKTAGAAKGEG